MTKYIYFIFLIVFPVNVFSQQIREFSTDTLEFIDQLEEFMSVVDEDEAQVSERFQQLWRMDSISHEEKLKIIEVSNFMLERRGRPSPHFLNYFTVFIMKHDGKHHIGGLDKLLEAMNYLAGEREVPFRETTRFMNLSVQILYSLELYNLANIAWKVSGENISFDMVNNRPVLHCADIDLSCFSNRDTLEIFSTSGNFNMISLVWSGQGGNVTWRKAGFNPDEVFAELSDYKIEINRAQFEADSVQFTYKKYFDYPLVGKLEERAMPVNSPETALYPKFTSYQNKYILPDLFKGIEFTGGLSMQGAKLIGTGTEGNEANLRVYENDTLRMNIYTENILIREKSMNSQSVSLTLYLEQDSVYHPDLKLVYMEESDEFTFNKGNNFSSGVPFINTYHKIDMNFESLSWIRGSGKIRIKPVIGRAIGQASFESQNFFDYSFFSDLQGMNYIHPLVSLWQFSKEVKNIRKFPVTAYAANMGQDPSQVRHQLMKLSRLGFVFYDEESDIVSLNDKLFYYLDASVGDTDYDVIYFNSRVQAPNENAQLDLSNYDLTINGIPKVFLSDSQNVVLVPERNQIVMKRNRNFQFDGEITAGLLSYFGKNFFFEYDSFKINLQNIDSMQVRVKNEDKNTGFSEIMKMDNVIENLTGEVLIDNPENKSGLEDFPEYPVFTSRENSYVYFDDKKIQDGVYMRDDVFFELVPFTIDSLDNFSREGMKLTGTFKSGGLLPPLEETLTLRDDNSLGFRYTTSDIGLPVYNGQGTFHHDIEMSSNGLIGSGRLDYLTSSAYSEKFILHPDSLMAKTTEFTIREKTDDVQFPRANSINNNILWFTKDEKYNIYREEKPFTMFEDTVLLAGDLLLEPTGLSGHGRIDMVSADLVSNEFKFLSRNILADTTRFELKSPVSDKLAISTDNVNTNIDFDQKSGRFFANENYTLVDFPETRYISNLNFFSWKIPEEKIEMGISSRGSSDLPYGEDELSGPRYFSVHPQQDSLNFVSPLAIYDYRNVLLTAQDVPYIQVADARIFPDEGIVEVERNAKMKQLTDAMIVTNYVTKYHKLFDADVTITGRFDYSASADYDYIDMTGNSQRIHFSNIIVDTSIQTIAEGELTMIDSFRLSPFFDYQGDVRLQANNPHLDFDGATRLVHDCAISRNWLRFESRIQPDSVMIPIPEQPLDINRDPIYMGTLITRDSTHVYSAFISTRKDYFDSYLTRADGFLRYDPYKEQFEVGALDKLTNKDLPGDFITLNRRNCIVKSEGEVDFQVNYGRLEMKTYGNAVHNTPENEFATKVLMTLDFMFSDEAMNELSRELDSLPNLKLFEITDPFYKKSMRDLVGLDAAERMEADMGLYGEYRTIPEEFDKKMIFSDVELKWNQYTRTFRYHGDIAVVRIGNSLINKKVEAYIELTKRTSGDLLDIYLKPNERDWYYFGYNPGSFQVVTSNRVFNQIVFNLKANKRKERTRPGTTGYIYSLAPDRRAQLFLRRFMAAEDEQQ